MPQSNYKQVFAKVKAELPTKANTALRSLAFHGLGAVKLRTPVDTGFLRNAWHVTDSLTGAGSGDLKRASKIYIVNNAEYAAFVEWGTRGRAGVGMARLTAQELKALAVQYFADAFAGRGVTVEVTQA